VQAVLEARSDHVVRWLREAAATAGDEPAAQLAAVFDALGGWHAEPAFRGCAIVNAATQQHTGSAPAIAKRHLDRHLDLMTSIAHRVGAPDPVGLGKQLVALIEGATVLADHHGDTDVAEIAKQAALTLLHAHRRQ
jgi:hypothetical protein